jgi:hypothetical protein
MTNLRKRHIIWLVGVFPLGRRLASRVTPFRQEAWNMKLATIPFRDGAVALSLVIISLSSGCGANKKTSEVVSSAAAERELAKMDSRVRFLERDLLAAQKRLIGEQQRTEELRRRLAAVELRLAMNSEWPVLVTPQPAGAVTSRAATSTPYSPPAVESPRLTEPQVIVVGGTQARTASAHCRQEWPGNFRMIAYCQEQQDAGENRIRERTSWSTGMPMNEFDAMHRGCESEWGENLRMRDYCEDQQVTAWKKVH